jgi:hypothetical protein
MGTTATYAVANGGVVSFRDAPKRSIDPTGTAALRREFRGDIAMRLRRMRAAMRTAIIDHDVLALGPSGIMAFHPDDVRLRAFSHWSNATIHGLVAGHWLRVYVQRASRAGVAAAALEVESGVAADHDVVERINNALEELATIEMAGIAAAVVQRLSRTAELVVAKKMTKAKAYRCLAQVFDKVACERASMLADTAVVTAFNRAKIAVYQAAGITTVGIDPEMCPRPRIAADAGGRRMRDADDETENDETENRRLKFVSPEAQRIIQTRFGQVGVQTAGDDKVCEKCEDLAEDAPYTLAEAIGLLPAHPRCRCAVFPWSDQRYARDALTRGGWWSDAADAWRAKYKAVMMIERQKVDGRDALVVYMTDDFEPSTSKDATRITIVFDDGNTIFAVPSRLVHDRTKHSRGWWSEDFDPNEERDYHGRWTAGGGGGSTAKPSHGKAEAGAPHGRQDPATRGRGRVRGGSASLEQAQAAAEIAAAGYASLEGLPDKPLQFKSDGSWYVPGPIGRIHDAAAAYVRSVGHSYDPPKQFTKLDKARATKIASAFDEMRHDPRDPAVKASYDAMVKETLAQWQALKATGLKVEWIKPGMKDPYAENPRLGAQDISLNNHWWGYPTDLGFGSGPDLADNPMLAPTDEVIDGRKCVVNDIFRIVHDMFGHFKEGVGFRAAGEENAWRSHAAMYSDLARGAMTTETRGQNSWVNYGPFGETNRTATAGDTQYAPQKVGLMPEWTWNEGRRDPGTSDAFDAPLPVVVFDPEKHPHIPKGEEGAGQWATTVTGDPLQMNPDVVSVGGDEWNQKVAVRLEYQYQRIKPLLDKLAETIVGEYEGEDIDEEAFEPGDDEDEEPVFVPEEWDQLSSDQQDEVASDWKKSAESDFQNSEFENWQENGGAMDDATTSLVNEWDKGPTVGNTLVPGTKNYVEEWPEWAEDAWSNIVEARKDAEQPAIPFTKDQVFKAISISFEGGNGTSWSLKGYGSKYGPDIELDHSALGTPIGWMEHPTLPGIEPEDPSERMTPEMIKEITDELLEQLHKKADSDAGDMGAPDWLYDNLDEQMNDYWDQKSDDEKFDWAKNNTSIIDDLEKEQEGQQRDRPEAVAYRMPRSFDPLGDNEGSGKGSEEYRALRALAREMSVDRAAEIMKERAVGTTSPRALAQRLDNTLWSEWKSSSTSTGGQLLQLAIAEELGGRVNHERISGGSEGAAAAREIREKADRTYAGGYAAVKAYVRGKWEVTQWMLDKAGASTITMYRGISIDTKNENIKEVEVPNPPLPGEAESGVTALTVFRQLPDTVIRRNGAASFTTTPSIANNWRGQGVTIRAEVPRTAVISVPVYGQNIHGEHESVVAGTAWKGWDAWMSPAPTADRLPIAHHVGATP